MISGIELLVMALRFVCRFDGLIVFTIIGCGVTLGLGIMRRAL